MTEEEVCDEIEEAPDTLCGEHSCNLLEKHNGQHQCNCGWTWI